MLHFYKILFEIEITPIVPAQDLYNLTTKHECPCIKHLQMIIIHQLFRRDYLLYRPCACVLSFKRKYLSLRGALELRQIM